MGPFDRICHGLGSKPSATTDSKKHRYFTIKSHVTSIQQAANAHIGKHPLQAKAKRLDSREVSVRSGCYACQMATTRKTSNSPKGNPLRRIAEIALETLWPTRCAVCDIPGERVLCKSCEESLKAIDERLACPKCGAPYGRIQCTECNDVMLSSSGIAELPFMRMSHAVILDEAARRIVTIYKDSDERRLAKAIAQIMSHHVNPDLRDEGFAITYIPDTLAAFRRRGFDHGMELAQSLASICDMECLSLLERPKSADQRKLARSERIENLRSRISVNAGAHVPKRLLLTDDVCTTGATVYSACSALKDAGAEDVHVITFAQVMD